MFGSRAAKIPGSSNIAGIADPAVDAMVDAALAADTRAELTTACRALDRVLRSGRYWIPMWSKAAHWLAYWDMYRPARGEAAIRSRRRRPRGGMTRRRPSESARR